MTSINKRPTAPADKPNRKAKWATPTMTHLAAGDAEASFGTGDDGYGPGPGPTS